MSVLRRAGGASVGLRRPDVAAEPYEATRPQVRPDRDPVGGMVLVARRFVDVTGTTWFPEATFPAAKLAPDVLDRLLADGTVIRLRASPGDLRKQSARRRDALPRTTKGP